MRERHRSRASKRSAFGVAALRYLGSFEHDRAVRNPDRLAGRLLPRRLRFVGWCPPTRVVARTLTDRKFPGTRLYHVGRTRFIDDVVARAVAAHGIRQVVVLGAGLDTRASRLSALRDPDVTVFELDFPDTSRRKQAAVRQAGLAHRARFIGIDLARDDLATGLQNAGLDADRPFVVVWEGVSMFLPEAAVRSTLSFVGDAPPGSAVVFDYVFESVVAGRAETYGSRETRAYLEEGEEPWRFGVDPHDVPSLVDGCGLALEAHLEPSAIEERYLRDSAGTVRGRVVGFHGLVHATAASRRTDRPGRRETGEALR